MIRLQVYLVYQVYKWISSLARK